MRRRWRVPAGTRRRRVLLGAVVGAVALGVVLYLAVGTGGSGHGRAVVSRPPLATPQTQQFGASVNLLFNIGQVSPAEVNGQLAALHATGATIARSDALWERTEPAPPVDGVHHYDWTFDDLIATSLAAHDLRWLPIVDYSPAWAQSIPGQDHSPPRSIGDYAAYARALAARYGADGSFWRLHPELLRLPAQAFEIWNEPDSSVFWVPAPDPALYAELYAAARQAVQAADPTARVLVGGLANGPGFLARMIAADPALRGRIDGVAIHAYGPTPSAVLSSAEGTRRALDAAGLSGVPLYVTEFGWTTSPPGATHYLPAPLRPQYIALSLQGLGRVACSYEIAAVILYTWFSPRGNPADSEQWFGISPAGAGGSRDVTAFTQSVQAVRESRPASAACFR